MAYHYRDGQGRVPMALRSRAWGDPDPQLSSPLYNGRIPPEIRALIFDFALTETTLPDPLGASHDFCVKYDHEPGDDEPGPSPGPESPGNTEAQMTDTPTNLAGELVPDSPIIEEAQQQSGHRPEEHETTAATEPQDSAGVIDQPSIINADFIRPDYRGHTVIYTALLRSCRRIYLETRHKPIQAKDFRFWTGSCNIFSSASFDFNRLPPDNAFGIRSLHLYATMRWLESHFRTDVEDSAKASLYSRGDRIRVLDRIENLRITIRRRDWWRHPSNDPLVINPFSDRDEHTPLAVRAADLNQTIREAVEGGMQQNGSSWSWSTAFLSMSKLKRLVIDFETSEDKKEELDAIVEWAKTWRFPVLRHWHLQDLMDVRLDLCPERLRRVQHAYLSTAGNPTSQMSWRGLPYHWAEQCPKCQSRQFQGKDCTYCLKATRLRKENKGPRLLVWTITWTAEPDVMPEPVEDSPEPSSREFSPESTPGKGGDQEGEADEAKLPAVPMPPRMAAPLPQWQQTGLRDARYNWLRSYTVQL